MNTTYGTPNHQNQITCCCIVIENNRMKPLDFLSNYDNGPAGGGDGAKAVVAKNNKII